MGLRREKGEKEEGGGEGETEFRGGLGLGGGGGGGGGLDWAKMRKDIRIVQNPFQSFTGQYVARRMGGGKMEVTSRRES